MKVIYLLFLFLILFFNSVIQAQTYTNAGPQLGLGHMYQSGFNGGGISFVDYDLDSYDDIFSTSSSGQTIVAYRNNIVNFTDVTNSFGFTEASESKATLVCDYDNDGDRDILCIHFTGILKFYKNNNGTYQDFTSSAGITSDSLHATTAIWFDYDRDGFLDLYIGVYTGFGNNIPKPNKLYRNNGNGTFQDVSAAANMENSGNKVLAMIAIDYNNDNWPDVYIASDRRYGNTLLKNNGNGTFSNVSQQSGTFLELDAMGLSITDFDNNGYFDIYVSNGEEGNAFLKNNGNGTFTEVAGTYNMSVNRICWGNNFFDYDNDGDDDLYIAVSGGPIDRYNVLFRNNGNSTFTQLTNIGLVNDNFQSYGSAAGDVNNDGYIDMVSMNTGDPVSLMKSSGGSNKWVKIKLQGTYSNREGIGALMEVYRGINKYKRYVTCGQSYCSQNSMVQTMGAGNSSVIDSIRVLWPSGIMQTVHNIPVNNVTTITEAGVIGINGNNTILPAEFSLSQNYPNPFNPSTIIEYSVTKSTNVSIKLYNILGIEVKELVNEYKTAGNYRYDINEKVTSGLSSGIYYYKMRAGEFSDTKKMILIK
ncbi:MAG: VCBS repeat-containing protein [Ignavibacteria bacterium]|nr:VCBS repeat-containing protein [Ignavibacteria bacterium]